MEISRALSCLVLILCTLHSLNAVNKAQEKDIRKRIRELIVKDEDTVSPGKRLLAGLVRLSFHDCAGKGCDGCINMDNPDNAGLSVYINLVEPLYQELKTNGTKLSRADFWALAGIESLNFGAEIGPPPRRQCPRCPRPTRAIPNIKFQYGRKDCTTSKPKGSPWTKDDHELPNPLWNMKKVLGYFSKTFGFSGRETVTILGAHTLGTAHPRFSGFRRPWVFRKDHFDNQFFKDLLDKKFGWHQTTAVTGNRHRGFTTKYMWESSEDRRPQTMMLNTDMCLVKDLGNMTSQGQASCSYKSCPDSPKWMLDLVEKFASDNNFFVSEFSKAYQKMISNGYKKLKSVK